MAKQSNTLFLEEWLRSISSSNTIIKLDHSSSSARAIIQAWAELRDSLQRLSFGPLQLQSLKILLNSHKSLHVADPQAKLVISILSSPTLSLPQESYPLFLRIFYIWARKSLKPSPALIDASVEAVSNLFSTQFESSKNPFFFSEGVLLLGTLSSLHSASENSKRSCLELLIKLLEKDYSLIGSDSGLIPDVLAGIGYALSSPSINAHYYISLLDSLLGIWGQVGWPSGTVTDGLMILHLIEWVVSNLISFRSLEKLDMFTRLILETSKESYPPFSVVMAASGALRAVNRSMSNGADKNIIPKLRISAEDRIESLARDFIFKTGVVTYTRYDQSTSLFLQCFSSALSRCGSVSSRSPFLMCLASSLMTEIFPLHQLYARILESSRRKSDGLEVINLVKEHLNSVPFKEAGAISSVFCNQYASADEESKRIVENHVWNYCRDIYLAHWQVALLLRGRKDVLGNLEKIAESAFLMAVVFALAVTKDKLNSNPETRMETYIKILISFSFLEYFRRIRLPEYMDTIREVVVSVQENESACAFFIESMPSYRDLTNGPDVSFRGEMKYVWTEDEVQTARVLFFLRVIPTCIELLPTHVFRKVVTPTMFLYLLHPNGKVARASHTVFAAFISSKDEEDERMSPKEELVFYYIERSLSEYPGITPFDGMASGVAAIVRHLPAGSPGIFYCIHKLYEKANSLCNEDFSQEPSKKILDLLIRLISLVDIQVLPDLMKLLAQLIINVLGPAQNVVLDELYSLVAESDDVTRKPLLVSWLQSLSYLCSQGETLGGLSKEEGSKRTFTLPWISDSLNWIRQHSRI